MTPVTLARSVGGKFPFGAIGVVFILVLAIVGFLTFSSDNSTTTVMVEDYSYDARVIEVVSGHA